MVRSAVEQTKRWWRKGLYSPGRGCYGGWGEPGKSTLTLRQIEDELKTAFSTMVWNYEVSTCKIIIIITQNGTFT